MGSCREKKNSDLQYDVVLQIYSVEEYTQEDSYPLSLHSPFLKFSIPIFKDSFNKNRAYIIC